MGLNGASKAAFRGGEGKPALVTLVPGKWWFIGGNNSCPEFIDTSNVNARYNLKMDSPDDRLGWPAWLGAIVILFPRTDSESLYLYPPILVTHNDMMSDTDPYDLRSKYTRFRILVIGRANAGKTTLLQRVCNTTEDPCIYDDKKNLVSVHKSKDEFCFLTFSTSLNLPQRYFIYYRYLLLFWPYRDLSARDTRYQSAVRIQDQSRFYLPRFTWIWSGRREATEGRPFVYGNESKVEWSRRSATCYLVSFAMISTYILLPDDHFCDERFCFVLNKARPLLPLEAAFFEKARAGNGFFLSAHHLSSNHQF